ncbi:cell division protein FtsA [Natranaerobius thermophilus]|uniref:Cell division protein FtsA n=1 Tax=Natranaerobius thermophilus (strain ATCC BAA-1301 / DSM 18059 / JW/NM-WN-LF) TaxID=457570 RepID=B2A2H5_NATTJ|nr:cell division protein FtsA [Natranaerobius thermophilus]ACB84890.1 cell division protein FtsA [Natranaerobius thermophilus JW/NM-WN-LF]
MTTKNLITGLDIGTTHVRVIVGEMGNGDNINIVGIGTSISEGLKNGGIVDLDKTTEAIVNAVEQAERMAGVELESTFVGIIGSHIQLIENSGVVAVSSDDKEITEEDVQRAVQAAKVIALPPDREIIDVIPRQFIVDGYDGIRDPVGMLGVRMEIEALVVAGKSTSIHNMLRCVTRAGLDVDGLVLNSMANAEAILTKDEQELGVAVVDIGGGTTEIGIFRNGNLQKLDVINIGGNFITNDISVGLKTPTEEAEQLKIKHGIALSEVTEAEEYLEIAQVGEKEPIQISAIELSNIVEPRVQEIFALVNKKLADMGYDEKSLPAGVVITGGVTKLKGVQTIAETELGLNVRIGEPKLLGVNNPIYSTGVGIINYVTKNNLYPREQESTNSQLTGFFGKVKNWLLDFFE